MKRRETRKKKDSPCIFSGSNGHVPPLIEDGCGVKLPGEIRGNELRVTVECSLFAPCTTTTTPFSSFIFSPHSCTTNIISQILLSTTINQRTTINHHQALLQSAMKFVRFPFPFLPFPIPFFPTVDFKITSQTHSTPSSSGDNRTQIREKQQTEKNVQLSSRSRLLLSRFVPLCRTKKKKKRRKINEDG